MATPARRLRAGRRDRGVRLLMRRPSVLARLGPTRMNRALSLAALGALALGCDQVSTLPAKPGQFVVVYSDRAGAADSAEPAPPAPARPPAPVRPPAPR